MCDLEIPAPESSEAIEAPEDAAEQQLDVSTVEPRSFVEQNADYQRAEAIERDFAALTEISGDQPVQEVASQSEDARGRPEAQNQLYVAHTSNDGETTITFGNGEEGARPPTGANDVEADYRSGVGAEQRAGSGAEQAVTNPGPIRTTERDSQDDAASVNSSQNAADADRVASDAGRLDSPTRPPREDPPESSSRQDRRRRSRIDGDE